MQLFNADAKIFLENLKKILCQQKVEKTTSKSCILKQKFRRFRNFLFTAQQPKWQNSWSQMGPIEQLYIELGLELQLLIAASGHYQMNLNRIFLSFFYKIYTVSENLQLNASEQDDPQKYFSQSVYTY